MLNSFKICDNSIFHNFFFLHNALQFFQICMYSIHTVGLLLIQATYKKNTQKSRMQKSHQAPLVFKLRITHGSHQTFGKRITSLIVFIKVIAQIELIIFSYLQLFSESTWRQERDAIWEQKENKADSAKHIEQKIMEWAKELQTVSEVRSACLTP